jgi:hypothetical protein
VFVPIRVSEGLGNIPQTDPLGSVATFNVGKTFGNEPLWLGFQAHEALARSMRRGSHKMRGHGLGKELLETETKAPIHNP